MIRALIQQEHNNSGKMVLQALIPFVDLKDVVLFTCKSNPRNSTLDNYSSVVEENYEYYQRRIDSSRLLQIESFIRQCILSEKLGYSITALFPTSLILAVNEDDGNEIKCSDDSCQVELRDNIFIVDGQHRMMAMKSLYEKLRKQVFLSDDDQIVLQYLESYKFNCVLLVNYDLWEQGQVFVNVNFKQKAVNKSLYYEVFGSQYNEDPNMWKQNHIFLAHSLTKVLNDNKQSPYFGKIKMLGTGKGYVSQAFFVESLIRQFSLNGIWSIYKESRSSDSDVKYMAVELLSYFAAEKAAFSRYWPKEDDDKGRVICKTTGTGAFVRLMFDMRNAASDEVIESLHNKEVSVSEKYYSFALSQFKRLGKEKTQYLFGDDSGFAGSSGKGSEVKMYKELRSAIFLTQKYAANDSLPFSINVVAEQLQEYLWENEQDDLDCLGYRYEYEDLSDLEVDGFEVNNGKYSLEVHFDSGVTIYVDNEDQTGFHMNFPSKATLKMEKEDNEWKLDTASVRVEFDTEKYYK